MGWGWCLLLNAMLGYSVRIRFDSALRAKLTVLHIAIVANGSPCTLRNLPPRLHRSTENERSCGRQFPDAVRGFLPSFRDRVGFVFCRGLNLVLIRFRLASDSLRFRSNDPHRSILFMCLVKSLLKVFLKMF